MNQFLSRIFKDVGAVKLPMWQNEERMGNPDMVWVCRGTRICPIEFVVIQLPCLDHFQPNFPFLDWFYPKFHSFDWFHPNLNLT